MSIWLIYYEPRSSWHLELPCITIIHRDANSFIYLFHFSLIFYFNDCLEIFLLFYLNSLTFLFMIPLIRGFSLKFMLFFYFSNYRYWYWFLYHKRNHQLKSLFQGSKTSKNSLKTTKQWRNKTKKKEKGYPIASREFQHILNIKT